MASRKQLPNLPVTYSCVPKRDRPGKNGKIRQKKEQMKAKKVKSVV